MTVLAGAAITLGVGACGSGGSGLTRNELAKQANQICADGQKQQASIGSPPRDFQTNPAAAAAFLDKYVPVIDGVAGKLQALKPVDGAKADWNAFVGKFQQTTKLIDSSRTKARNKDASGINDLRQAVTLTTPTNAAATKVGATTCAK